MNIYIRYTALVPINCVPIKRKRRKCILPLLEKKCTQPILFSVSTARRLLICCRIHVYHFDVSHHSLHGRHLLSHYNGKWLLSFFMVYLGMIIFSYTGEEWLSTISFNCGLLRKVMYVQCAWGCNIEKCIYKCCEKSIRLWVSACLSVCLWRVSSHRDP